MPEQIVIASALIFIALLLYSIGVWSERFAGRLKIWHLLFFWGGLCFDTAGTGIMFEFAGQIGFDIHGITGVLAILLMFIHAIWATAVIIRKDEKAIVNFHHFSVFVWLVWLIPFITGLFVSVG